MTSDDKRPVRIIDPRTGKPVDLDPETGQIIKPEPPKVFNDEDESSNGKMVLRETERVMRAMLGDVVAHDREKSQDRLIRSMWLVAGVSLGALLLIAILVFAAIHAFHH